MAECFSLTIQFNLAHPFLLIQVKHTQENCVIHSVRMCHGVFCNALHLDDYEGVFLMTG